MWLTIIAITILTVLLLFITNAIRIASIIPGFILGGGGYFIAAKIIETYISEIEGKLEYIFSGFLVLLILGLYSRTQDSLNTGPSALRAEIQGLGVYAFLVSLLLAWNY